MAPSRPDLAYPVTQRHPVVAFGPALRPAVHGKDHGIAPRQRDDLDAGLHARPLLGDGELAALEFPAGLREQDGDLEREDMLAIEVPVEAVVVAGTILQQQRSRAFLTGRMAPLEKRGVLLRKAGLQAHPLVPSIGDRREPPVEGRAQALNQYGERIGEVAILASAEAVPGHHHVAAKDLAGTVRGRRRVALL